MAVAGRLCRSATSMESLRVVRWLQPRRCWPLCALVGHDDHLQRSGTRMSDGVSSC